MSKYLKTLLHHLENRITDATTPRDATLFVGGCEPVFLFSTLINLFLVYFDPVNIFLDN